MGGECHDHTLVPNVDDVYAVPSVDAVWCESVGRLLVDLMRIVEVECVVSVVCDVYVCESGVDEM